jgi:hypothetical protein
MAMLHDRIADAGIDVRFIADRVGEARGRRGRGRIYTLFDVYPHADLVTYPSHYEGFGNAFLEAIYFGKPVVVNTVCRLRPRHRSARLQDHRAARSWSPARWSSKCAPCCANRSPCAPTGQPRPNYALGLKYFSYAVARRKLAARLANLFGEGL